jgi:N-methylhydantoinase A
LSWHVGIDTGGTFTDLAARDPATGQRYITKVPSTPGNPATGILGALRQFATETGATLGDVEFFAHGTTVGTNAVLEGKGARAGLLMTRGFKAIYEVRGGIRPARVDLVDPRYRKPAPLVPLHLTHYVDERVAYDGSVLEPLDEDSVRAAVEALKAEGVESIAVLCLFSFMNSGHEERIAEIVRESIPECRVSLSSRVLPVIREYVRLSTTALDAYVGPVVARYFEELAARLSDAGLTTGQSYVMQSNGGLMRITVSSQHPNEILLSGPASGVVFGLELGRLIEEQDVVTFDMGGTSTDISIIKDGAIAQTREGKIAGQEIGSPMTEIHTIGAGGGTIAWIGSDGLLKVGPQSAGADPGPACYDRGGVEPTVTDSNVLLGYLDPTRFLGGRMSGRPELSHAALERLGEQLAMSPLDAAVGVNRIINTHMAVGLRLTLEAKGCDPGRFVLVAFGGAGPLHAWRLAEDCGIPRIAVPPHPGIACAMGLLETDIVHVYMQSFLVRIDRTSPEEIARRFDSLLERALADAIAEGFTRDDLQIVRQVDLRYPHQGYELSMDCRFEEPSESDLEQLRNEFDLRHEQIYGVSAPTEPVELVNLRIRAVVPVESPAPESEALAGTSPDTAQTGERTAYFHSLGVFQQTPVYDRGLLRPGTVIAGPAIIEQLDTTTVIGPGWTTTVDPYSILTMERDA